MRGMMELNGMTVNQVNREAGSFAIPASAFSGRNSALSSTNRCNHLDGKQEQERYETKFFQSLRRSAFNFN
jgi:hypothetical protein